jgi:FixJ family two-component response regulator
MQCETLLAVVDDDEDVRAALTRLIGSAGFAVESFASGGAFLRSVEDHKPACVVLDLHMPGMNGQQVTGTLGCAQCDHDYGQQQATAAARSGKFGGVIKNEALQSKALVGAARGAAERRAQRAADHHRRRRLRRAQHLRRRDPDADDGPHCQRRPALQPHVLHRAVLADARRADHRAQPPFGRLRGDFRTVDTGYPGYNSIIGKDKATIGRMLLDNGYATSWFGKNHNTPAFAASQVGPFDQWPTGMGFEYFYGFVGGDANQWQPNLFRNTTQIFPFQGKPGWNLITGMADDAIDYMTRIQGRSTPEKPIFIKYAPGGDPCAAPPDTGSGWTRSAPCICSTSGYEQVSRDDLRQPEEVSASWFPRTPSSHRGPMKC